MLPSSGSRYQNRQSFDIIKWHKTSDLNYFFLLFTHKYYVRLEMTWISDERKHPRLGPLVYYFVYTV
jgi:hypothetical protein